MAKVQQKGCSAKLMGLRPKKSLEPASATRYYGALGERQPDITRSRGVEARSHKEVRIGACRAEPVMQPVTASCIGGRLFVVEAPSRREAVCRGVRCRGGGCGEEAGVE